MSGVLSSVTTMAMNLLSGLISKWFKYEYIHPNNIFQPYELPLYNGTTSNGVNKYQKFGPIAGANGLTNDLYLTIAKAFTDNGSVVTSWQLYDELVNVTGQVGGNNNECYQQDIGPRRNYPIATPIYGHCTLYVTNVEDRQGMQTSTVRDFKTWLDGGPFDEPSYQLDPINPQTNPNLVQIGTWNDGSNGGVNDKMKVHYSQPFVIKVNGREKIDKYVNASEGIHIPVNSKLIYTVIIGSNFADPSIVPSWKAGGYQQCTPTVVVKSQMAFLWVQDTTNSDKGASEVVVSPLTGTEVDARNENTFVPVLGVQPGQTTVQNF